MYTSVYVGQARWSLEVRVDMNAAALLQQTAPYSCRSAYLFLRVLPRPRTLLSPRSLRLSLNCYRHRYLINISYAVAEIELKYADHSCSGNNEGIRAKIESVTCPISEFFFAYWHNFSVAFVSLCTEHAFVFVCFRVTVEYERYFNLWIIDRII